MKHECPVTEIETDKEMREPVPGFGFCKKQNYMHKASLKNYCGRAASAIIALSQNNPAVKSNLRENVRDIGFVE